MLHQPRLGAAQALEHGEVDSLVYGPRAWVRFGHAETACRWAVTAVDDLAWRREYWSQKQAERDLLVGLTYSRQRLAGVVALTVELPEAALLHGLVDELDERAEVLTAGARPSLGLDPELLRRSRAAGGGWWTT